MDSLKTALGFSLEIIPKGFQVSGAAGESSMLLLASLIFQPKNIMPPWSGGKGLGLVRKITK